VRPASSRNAQIAVAATCLIAAGCFAGVVTQRALFGFLLPGWVIGGGAFALLAATFSMRSALPVSLALGLGWAQIANVATGISNGPAARSTLAVSALTSLALAASRTRMPALFLCPVAGVVAAADLLGAGDEVPLVAVLTSGAAVVTLASVESARRRQGLPKTDRQRYWSVAVLGVLTMGAASVAVLTQSNHDGNKPRSAVNAIENSAVRPFWSDPFPSSAATRPKRHHVPATPPVKAPERRAPEHHSHTWMWIALGLLAALVLGIVARLLLVRRAWERALRALMTGPPEGMVGAWIWATLRFRAFRMPLPPQLSPDRVARGAPIHEVPPDTAEPLRQLGLLVAPVAFRSPHAVADQSGVDAAWSLAKAACAAAEGSLGIPGRLRVRFVSPGAFGLHVGN
jgi:hypothetical protein